MHPGYYPPAYPPPRPRRSSGTVLIVVGSIVLGVGILGILAQVGVAASRARNSAHVGQCIAASSTRDPKRTPAPQDCDKPDSVLEVAATGDSRTVCPDGKLQDSLYEYLSDGITTLCLMLNLKQGQCYTARGTAENPEFDAADCDGSDTMVRVVKRVDGSSDAALCPAVTKPISYPVPARLYCLERVDN